MREDETVWGLSPALPDFTRSTRHSLSYDAQKGHDNCKNIRYDHTDLNFGSKKL
jgi:hypothetical protein